MKLRRRRLATALALLLAGVAGLAALAVNAVSSGSSGTHPHYIPGDTGPNAIVDSTAAPAATSGSASPASGQPRPRPFRPAAAAVSTAASMSLSEQVAQLFVVPADGGAVAPPGAGGVLAGSGAPATAGTAGRSGTTGSTGSAGSSGAGAQPVRPLIVAVPPHPDGSATSPAGVRAQATAEAATLKAQSVSLALAPTADVADPGSPMAPSLFSTSPSLTAGLAAAAASAYEAAGIIPAVGHFPGQGAASADPDQTTATVGGTLGALEGRDLIPFAQLIAAGVPVIVMSNAAYAAFDGVTPASLLPAAVDLLRDHYGFTGVVMSDDLDETLNATGEDPGQTAVHALEAGDDLLYITGPSSEHMAAYDAVLAAAQRSAATRRLVRQALLHDLTLKAGHGGL